MTVAAAGTRGQLRDCSHPRVKHQHGSRDAYIRDACRCDACTRAANEYNITRRRGIAFGRWEPFVDATGTIRRLQALTAAGWSSRELGQQLGMSKTATNKVRGDATTQRRVHRDTAARVAYLYSKLADARPTGRYQLRSELYAQRLGWAAPWQWTDGTIDEPDAEPIPAFDDGPLDSVLVDRIANGLHVVPLFTRRQPELIAAVLQLHARGLSDSQVGERVGRTADAVWKIRFRHSGTEQVAGRTA